MKTHLGLERCATATEEASDDDAAGSGEGEKKQLWPQEGALVLRGG